MGNLNPYQTHSVTSTSLLTANIQGAASLELSLQESNGFLHSGDISPPSNAQALTKSGIAPSPLCQLDSLSFIVVRISPTVS